MLYWVAEQNNGEAVMNIDAYAKPIVIQGYECDPNNRMGLGAVLRRAQQIAVEQCAGLGMTEALYAKTHTAFLMAKLTAEFYQHAFVARVLQWISDDMDLAPDKLAMVCECMFRGTVKGALESAQKVAENLEN